MYQPGSIANARGDYQLAPAGAHLRGAFARIVRTAALPRGASTAHAVPFSHPAALAAEILGRVRVG
jgi:hypothetical protein